MENLESLSQLGLNPIPGDSPAGVSVRYEPDFETLQQEIAKLESVTQGPVSWSEVVRLARTLLETRSKDLLVSAYLTLGLFHVEGNRGLPVGLTVMKDMLATFWEDLFPPVRKIRGRVAALRWLDERLGSALAEAPGASEADREDLKTCASLVDTVDQLANEKFPDGTFQGGPVLGDLGRAVREKVESIRQAETSTAAAVTGPPAAAASAEITSAADAHKLVRKAAAYLRKKKPEDPLPYRLLRSVLWAGLQDLPQHTDGVCRLSGGDEAFLASLEESLAAGHHQAVLDRVESRLATDRFWLDLNHVAVRAMESLGAAYEGARHAIHDEVGNLLRRLPGLVDLRFQSGVPFVSSKTRAWLEGDVLAAAAEKPARTQEEPDEGGVEELVATAGRLAASGKLPEAVRCLQEEIRRTPGGRERFILRLHLAKVCLNAKDYRLALPLLESLDEDARRHQLDEWETSLAVEVVRHLWQCYHFAPKAGTSPEKAAEVYSRLCRLDPSTAAAVKPKR